MTASSDDLNGNAPHEAPVVLLLIDVINDLEFDGGEQVLEHALPAARRLAALKQRARARDVPVVYANDNFGRWRSNFDTVVQHCLDDGVRGESIARLLTPCDDDYSVLKPKHSAFFATTLDLLLEHFGARTLILGGITTEMCVLFTAIDAYMRGYTLHIPRDCAIPKAQRTGDQLLAYMRRTLDADMTPSEELDLDGLIGEARAEMSTNGS